MIIYALAPGFRTCTDSVCSPFLPIPSIDSVGRLVCPKGRKWILF